MSNKLVAELALDAFPIMSYQAVLIERELDSCESFSAKHYIIRQLYDNNYKDENTSKVFNAMLCLISDNVGQVIRYMVR